MVKQWLSNMDSLYYCTNNVATRQVMEYFKQIPLVQKPLKESTKTAQIAHTFTGCIILASLAVIPLYGLKDNIEIHPLDALFCIRRGTLFHLGFQPVLTAVTIAQIVGYSYKGLNTRRMTIAISEALVVYFSWTLSTYIIAQLLLINLLVVYLDDAMTNYALLSGYSVLQLCSAGSTLAIRLFSPLSMQDGHMQGILSEAYFNNRVDVEDVLGCVAMCLLVMVILYARSIQIHIPIHKGRYKTYHAIPMLYSSTQPIFWYLTLQSVAIRAVQYFNISYSWVTLPETYLQHPVLTFSSVMLCAVCVVGSSKLWMRMANKTTKDVCKEIVDNGFLVQGVRKSSMVNYIHRYIEDAVLISSSFILCMLILSACLKPWLGAMRLFIVLPASLALHEKRKLRRSPRFQ
jgi:preprotein translocase subunit SecY